MTDCAPYVRPSPFLFVLWSLLRWSPTRRVQDCSPRFTHTATPTPTWPKQSGPATPDREAGCRGRIRAVHRAGADPNPPRRQNHHPELAKWVAARNPRLVGPGSDLLSPHRIGLRVPSPRPITAARRRPPPTRSVSRPPPSASPPPPS